MTRADVGYLLAKASQRWNELVVARFAAEGFPEVRPSYGSVLVPLYEEDGLRMGEVGRRARLSKQTITHLVRATERDGLVVRAADEHDSRATRVWLTDKARRFEPVAARVLGQVEQVAAGALGEDSVEVLRRVLAVLSDLDRT
ncbi:MAG: MarR family transcriptional regulator [Myxococcota bacterium]